jgi:DNA-binding NarL/FixJ family response regulator
MPKAPTAESDMVKKKSILVVDDHPLVREGLKVIIGRSSRFEVIGEAGSAREGVRMADELKPDLVLLDISLPDQNGLEVARKIRSSLPETRILVLSMYSKIDYVAQAFKSGATGYMVKESAADKLINALESVARGEYYLDHSLSHQVVEELIRSPEKETKILDATYRSLTPREQEIMRMLAAGLSTKEIADKLFISPKTVENHRTNIMSKLGLHGSIELARYAARLGLIDVDEWKD